MVAAGRQQAVRFYDGHTHECRLVDRGSSLLESHKNRNIPTATLPLREPECCSAVTYRRAYYSCLLDGDDNHATQPTASPTCKQATQTLDDLPVLAYTIHCKKC